MGEQSQLLLKPTEVEFGLQVGVEFDKKAEAEVVPSSSLVEVEVGIELEVGLIFSVGWVGGDLESKANLN